MKAAVSYETNTPMRVEEVILDDPQDHEVLVKLAAAGTCHSALHFMKGDIPVPTPETHSTSNLISHPVFFPKLQRLAGAFNH